MIQMIINVIVIGIIVITSLVGMITICNFLRDYFLEKKFLSKVKPGDICILKEASPFAGDNVKVRIKKIHKDHRNITWILYSDLNDDAIFSQQVLGFIQEYALFN
jgi:hypothetical protein